MKVKIIVIIALIFAGVAVAASLVSGQKETKQQYDDYIAAAEYNAEKEIPYMAVANYQRAMQIDHSDESVYQSYLEQCKLLGEDYYASACENYVSVFPESMNAYDVLCDYYYEAENYKKVISTALEARDKNLASDKIKDYYMECSVKYKTFFEGLDEVTPFLGEYARVKMGDLYGYISAKGGYYIYPMYEGASFFLGGSTAVFHENEWYMMNGEGYKVARTDKPVDSMNFANNGWVLFSLDGKYDYMTTELIVPEEIRFDNATNFKKGIAAVQKDGKWALINSNNEFVTEFVFEDVIRDEYNTCFNNGVIFAKSGEKYYMYDANGQKISENGFDDAHCFISDDPAAVCVNGKWGFVDASGNYVIEPKYEDAQSFSIGLGAVCVNGLWGYINASDTMRMEPQFADCMPFCDYGITAIKKDAEEKWTLIKLIAYES